MKRLLPFFLALSVSFPTFAAKGLPEKAYDATAILYKQTTSGGMDMVCTVTAFEKDDGGYLFVSASHCVANDDAMAKKAIVEPVPYFISFDREVSKTFHVATVLMAGYQLRGDDFAILRVETDEKWQTIPIGDSNKVVMGEEVLNVAAPGGYGRQIFWGRVALLNMDRPVISRSINWMNAMLVQIPASGGSSGSSVVSLNQEAIVCFIVGGITGNPSSVAVSAARFLDFRERVEDGRYKWFGMSDQGEK